MYRGYQCIYSIIETTEKDFDVVNSDKYKKFIEAPVPAGTSHVCFSYIFGRKCFDYLLIKAFANPQYAIESGESNVCVLTKDEIIFFVDQIKELYKVDIDVFFHEKHKSRNKFSKYPFFVISYKSSDNLFIDKVVLTLLRYMFEEPYNLILKTVFLMADDNSFKDNDFWFNFETAIGCCQGGGGHGFLSIYTIQPLKLDFKENEVCRVNAMVKYCGESVSDKRSINFTSISDDILYEDKDYSCGLKFLNLYEEKVRPLLLIVNDIKKQNLNEKV